MSGNKKTVDLPLLSSPVGSETYVVKTSTDYRLPIGSALGLATLGTDGKLDPAQAPSASGGTVTSVAVANATGLTWTGSPITTSGTLTPTLSANLQSWSAIAPTAKADTTHTHPLSALTQSGATSGQVAQWNGTSWVPASVSASSGTVTSVDAAGGTTGFTFSGGPVTTSGTLTIAGTLAVAHGGTGATTAAGARTALDAAATSHNHDATHIVTGLVAPARLGTGTASNTTFLRGDGTWATPSGSGSVTSVDASGGTTGMTFSGGPITGSGVLTMAGTMAIANGGTGATTAAAAVTALGAAPASHTHDATHITTGILDVARIPALDTSKITTGFFHPTRLGAGTHDTTTFLRGDNTWVVPPGGSGTVTSVNVSGGTTGLTTSGGPVTTSGTITIAGTLGIANGGTGGNSASAARVGLGIYVQSTDPGAVADGSLWIW